METVSCNADECNNSVSLEKKISNPKKKKKRSKKQNEKEKPEFEQTDGEILTWLTNDQSDPNDGGVGVISVSNVETVEEKNGTARLSGSEVDAVNEEKKKKKGKKMKMNGDKTEEDGSANVLQDADVNLVDNSMPLQDHVSVITDKEIVGVLGEGDSASIETKKEKKLKRKRKQRKNKEQEGESGGSNVNELQVEKSVEDNQVSVETSSINVKVLQDVDVNLVDNSVPFQDNVSLIMDKEKVGLLGEGDGVSTETKKKKKPGRRKHRKNKKQESESRGSNVDALQVEDSVETNQVSVEMSSINVISSKDLDEENCRKRRRLDGSLEGNLESSVEDVEKNVSLIIDNETKKEEKLKRKSKEQEGESGGSNVNGLQVEKSLCCTDNGEKVESLNGLLGQVEVREQTSSEQVDVKSLCLEISNESSREKPVLIDTKKGVNLPISKGDIREVTLSKNDHVAETSGAKNDVEQQVQDQHVPQTLIDNNSESRDDNPKGESNSKNLVLQTCEVVNTDSTVAVCLSEGIVSKDDVVFDVIDKENKTAQHVQHSNKTAQHVQHSLAESIEVKQSRKKLLILDVNGLLADILPLEKHVKRQPDAVISGKAVFKRPFMDDFLQFCFDNFAVGVWSSRTKRNVEMVVNFLMGNSREKLLFCWDQSHCTGTKFSTVQNRDKPLVFKELKKLWEKLEPDLPWMKGEYNESNTLLLDDSPYKALLNPAYTAIFPYSYEYTDSKDNSLGPGGDLWVYLEQLALAENVQDYVQQNPFGQRAITSRNPSWGYYQKVIAAISSATITALPR